MSTPAYPPHQRQPNGQSQPQLSPERAAHRHPRRRRRIIIRRRLTMAERMRARLTHATRWLLALRPRFSLNGFLFFTSVAAVSLSFWQLLRDDHHANLDRVYEHHQNEFWESNGGRGALGIIFASTRPKETTALTEMVKKAAAEGKWNHFAAIAQARPSDPNAAVVLEAYLDSERSARDARGFTVQMPADARYKDAAMHCLAEHDPSIKFDLKWSKDRRDEDIAAYQRSR